MPRRFVLALALLAAPLLSAADAPALAIGGSVVHPAGFSVAVLRALPARTAEGNELINHTGAKLGGPFRYTGVRLVDLLTRAGLKEPTPMAHHRAVVTAAGVDGYRVAFSWHELTNTAGGAEVLVAYERDGKALDPAKDGPLVLIAPRDVITGPRQVRNLARLTVGFSE